MIPITYQGDRKKAEGILLEVVRNHVPPLDNVSENDVAELNRRYPAENVSLQPVVYYRLTDNWLELSIRFVISEYGVWEIKNAISRELLDRLEEAGISVASQTYDIVGLPVLKVQLTGQPA